jgi:succinate dehydrogenase hydrophobic anchor subunit
MKKLAYSVAGLIGFAPVAAFAQYTVQTTFVDSVLNLIQKLLSFAFPALTAIAVLVFIFMLIKFIMAEPAKKEDSRKGLVMALIALFVILALFGIINVLKNVTGTQGTNTIDSTSVPHVDFSY